MKLSKKLTLLVAACMPARNTSKTFKDPSADAFDSNGGKPEVGVGTGSNDEIGLLAQTFNAIIRDLRKNENKYRDLAELLPQIVFEADARGTVTFVNRHGLDIFGYTRQDIEKGLSFLDVFAPQDRDRLRENMGKRLGGEKGDSVEYTAMRKDGSTFPFLVFTVPIRHDDKVLGIRGIGIDITERKRTEDELRQREWQLAEAQRIAHLGSWVWRVGEDKATWTDELYRMLGLNPGDVAPLAETYLQFVHPDDRDVVHQAVHDTMVGGIPTAIEHRIIKKDGVVRFFHSQTDVVRDDSGKPVLTRGVVRDITERKKAEQEAREREAFLSNILDSIQDGIVILDDDFNVVRANPTLEKVFHHKMPLAGRKCYEAFHNRAVPCESCPSIKTLETGKPETKVFVANEGEPEPVWIELYTFPLFDQCKTRVTGVIECARDITMRKKAEQEVHKFESLVENSSDFIGIASLDGKLLYINKAGRKLIGLREDEDVTGKRILDLYAEETVAEHEAVLRYVVMKSGSWNGETLMKHQRTGEAIPVEMSRFVITETGTGRPLALATVNRDITERKRITEELRDLEHKYHHIFDNLTDAALVADAQDGMIIDANLMAEQLLGRPRHEIIGMLQSEVHPPGKAEEYRTRFATHVQKGHQADYDGEIIRKDGTIVPVSIAAAPSMLAGQNIILGLFRDITERKLAEKALQEQFHFLQVLIDAIPAPVFYKDDEGVYIGCNKAYEEYIGRKKKQIVGKTVYDLAPKELAETYRMMDLALFKEQKVQKYESSVIYADGTNHNVIFNKAPFKKKDGRLGGLVGAILDISERKLAEESLRESEERYRSVVDNIGIGIALISPNMEILSLNRQMKEWSPAIDVSQRPICFRSFNRPPKEEICSYCPTVKTLRDGQVHEAITETPVEGGIINYKVVSSPLKDGEGRVIAVIELVEDITKRQRSEDEIKMLNQELARLYDEAKTFSLIDPLTGLGNRRFLKTQMEQHLESSRRYSGDLSVIMLDIDHFKEYNDTHGHIEGDRLLSRIADILRNTIRGSDQVFRYGGEEFLIMLSNTDAQSVGIAAERFRKVIESDGHVTISLGVSFYGESIQNSEDLIAKADEALYRAKQNGRNRVEVYGANDSGPAVVNASSRS